MISVCLATYNGSKYIVEQIDSILSQLELSDELVISDDGSNDDTVDIVRSYKDERIKLIFNEGEKGYTNNFQNALVNCIGDYIFLSDQDDIWMPRKVELCLKELEFVDFVVHDARVVDSKVNVLFDSYFSFRGVKSGFFNNFIKIGYLGCCMAFKRNVVDRVIPFPCYKNYITHDSWLTLMSEFYFKSKLIHEPLISYRRHSENTSQGGNDEGNSLLTKVNIRIYSLIQILKA